MAEDGYRRSSVEKVRTHTRACFEYATDEDLIQKNPDAEARHAEHQKEVMRTLSEHGGDFAPCSLRRRLANIWSCGFWPSADLRPAEILVLRMEDFEGTQLRIDEALKERQQGRGSDWRDEDR